MNAVTGLKALRRLDPSVFHLYAFDRKSIRGLLQTAGFERITVSNSLLAGTRRPEQPGGPARRLGVPLLEILAALLSGASGKRLLLAPSLWGVAIRPAGESMLERNAP